MKAISLHQPWASLLVTRQPHAECATGTGYVAESCDEGGMVKRFETRSWPCPPSIIGQHVAFASTKRKPKDFTRVGDFEVVELANGSLNMVRGAARFDRSQHIPLPLGCVVGSGVITASYPIVTHLSTADHDCSFPCVAITNDQTYLYVMRGRNGHQDITDISDQLPYGTFEPGRYAWQIEDAAPTTERCPRCWNAEQWFRAIGGHANCAVCHDAGRCDPIPVTGRQGWFEWQPT